MNNQKFRCQRSKQQEITMIARLDREKHETVNSTRSSRLKLFLETTTKKVYSKTRAIILATNNSNLIEYDQRLREMSFRKGLETVALDTFIFSAATVTAPLALAADALLQRRILNRYQSRIAWVLSALDATTALTACGGQVQSQHKPRECVTEPCGAVPSPTASRYQPLVEKIPIDSPSNTSQKVMRYGIEVDLKQFDQAIISKFQEQYPYSDIQIQEPSRSGNTGQGCYAGCVRRDGINSDLLNGGQALDILLGQNYEKIKTDYVAHTTNGQEKLKIFNQTVLPKLLPGDHIILLDSDNEPIHCATFIGHGIFSQTLADNLPTITSKDFLLALDQYWEATSIEISRLKR